MMPEIEMLSVKSLEEKHGNLEDFSRKWVTRTRLPVIGATRHFVYVCAVLTIKFDGCPQAQVAQEDSRSGQAPGKKSWDFTSSEFVSALFMSSEYTWKLLWALSELLVRRSTMSRNASQTGAIKKASKQFRAAKYHATTARWQATLPLVNWSCSCSTECSCW